MLAAYIQAKPLPDLAANKGSAGRQDRAAAAMTDEPPERPLFSVEERLPEGKVIHRWVEPPDGDAEAIGGQLRRMFKDHPGHSVYTRMLDDGRLEMIVVEGALEER